MIQPLSRWSRVPRLTRLRMALALGVALFADALQFCLGWLGPIEWAFIDPVIDTAAAVATNWLLGFHILLLPTFVIKLVPLAEELPTWTACVAAVIVLRKREERHIQTMLDKQEGLK
jgi:hypothetical protein